MTPMQIRPAFLALAALIGVTPAAFGETSAPQNNELLAYAHDTGALAGSARFCEVDEELVDEFISQSEARLRLMSKDEYESVLARLEFKNVMAANSAKAPQMGCKAFLPQFETMVKSAR